MKSSILWQFTKRSLAKNRTRTIVSIIGIILSTALICGIFTTVSSVHGALLNRLVAFEGSWHAMSSDVKHQTIEKLVKTKQVQAAASSTEVMRVNFASKGANDEARENFTIRTMPQILKGSPQEARKLTTQPSITKGSFPTTKNQIALPETCRNTRFADANVYSDEKIDVGSIIHLKVNGTIQDWAVSGFYDSMNSFYGNSLVAHGTNGYLGLAAAETTSYTNSNRGMVWYRLTGFSHQDELSSHVEKTLGIRQEQNAQLKTQDEAQSADATDASAKPQQFVIFHQNLMRSEGLRGKSANWDALWNMGIFLAIIISVASIALIYNSFSISVAERKKQFGLLASLGASKAQIRRMIYLETLSIATVGIPVGIICGLAGVAATLWLARDGFSVIFEKTGMISLAINPLAVLITVGFELVVLFISATIPALRASRVSPIAAIRQAQDIKISRRLSKKLMRWAQRAQRTEEKNRAAAGGITPRFSLFERLFGTEGMLSARNLSRASSRGRTITASLAVSVTLIVITGVIAGIFLPYALAKNDMVAPDILVRVTSDGRYDPEELAQKLEKTAAQISGLKPVEKTRRMATTLVFKKGTLTKEMRDYLAKQAEKQSSTPHEGDGIQGVTIKPDGSRVKDKYSDFAAKSEQWSATYNIVVPSPESWEKLVAAYGVDPDTGMLLFNKQTIGASVDGTEGPGAHDSAGPLKKKTIKPFTDVAALSHSATLLGRKNGNKPYGMPLFSHFDSADQLVVFDSTVDKQDLYIPLSSIERELVRLPLKSVALLEKSPRETPYMFSTIFSPDNFMIMSPVLYKRYASYFDTPAINYMYMVQSDEQSSGQNSAQNAMQTGQSTRAPQAKQTAAKATEQLRESLKAQGFSSNTFDIYDFSTARRNDVLVAQTLLLFMGLFTGIMLLISMSNVFNTLCNSMILRTSEFAILRSIGMSEKQFRLMIFYECLCYALRGLIWGALISMGAYWLFWKHVIMRFDSAIVGERMAFSIPWVSFISASLCVMVVLVLSVWYALRKTKAHNIVEVLRNEAI